MKNIRRFRFPLRAAICLLVTLSAAVPARSQLIPPHTPSPQSIVGKRFDKCIALLPERNVFAQRKRYLGLEHYLSQRLDMKVHFKILPHYSEVFNQVRQKTVDGAFLGSMGGAMALTEGLVDMLARPVWRNGVSTYNGYIFTRKGHEKLRDPANWKGKRIALVSKVTTAGYLFPLSAMRAAKIESKIEAYFSHVVFTGSHDAAILAVLKGQVDLGAAKNTVYDEYLRLHAEEMKDLTVVLQSRHVPENGLGMGSDVSAEFKNHIKKTLLAMDKDPEGRVVLKEFGAMKFIETSKTDYQPVVDMAKKAGIDLTRWSALGFR